MIPTRTILVRLATSPRLERAVRAAPLGEHLAWRFAARYGAGISVGAALRTAMALRERSVGSSIDFFGEQVGDAGTAELVTGGYLTLAAQVSALPPDMWLSVDLSHLGLDVDLAGCANHRARSPLNRATARSPA